VKAFVSDDRSAMEALRRELPRAWPALFQRFGRLTAIQVQGLPPLLAEKNVVLCSATASGKTEAMVAPFAERARAGAGPQILWIVPTRALCNDLARRLCGPLSSLGLRLAVRTGDRPELCLKDPQEMVVTTPESFDSLLCRAPTLFRKLQGLVLDELHQVDGTYRGDQLRILLRRLERLLDRAPQYGALSATLFDPERLARRYFPDPVVVRAPGIRSLRLELVSDLPAAVELLKSERRRKVLVFGNRRSDVEQAAQVLARHWPPDRIVVHHASLSRAVRERAEAAMRQWPFGICVATTTLETGLDIGDLDATVLLGAPPTPSAFQQRAGRACRREETVFVVGCAASEEERALFLTYADLARRGIVEPRPYEPDLSVVVQQVFSLCFAEPAGVLEPEATALLAPLCSPPALAEILQHLVDGGLLVRRGGRIAAAAPVMDLGEKGRLHSNIPDSREWRVVLATSGATLGTVFTSAALGDRFYLAGRPYQVTRTARSVLYVVPASGEARAATFAPRTRGAFSRYLPQELSGV
jgi:ATP-dependent Lhr-like helicase